MRLHRQIGPPLRALSISDRLHALYEDTEAVQHEMESCGGTVLRCLSVPRGLALCAMLPLICALGCQSGDQLSDVGDGRSGGDGCLPSPDVVRDTTARDVTVEDGPSSDMTVSDAEDGSSLDCPPCMVLVDEAFCMDRYEASRPDATVSSQGSRWDIAVCAAGVIPWYSPSLTRGEAASACAAAGKRLCTTTEWVGVCQGAAHSVYSYGNDYDPVICNGIDRFCACSPYPHCYESCGADFDVAATGSHGDCLSTAGTFDMNGNVWELVEHGDDKDHLRGGAFNCGDSEALHRCDHDADWGPSARGFRCCAQPLSRR